MEDISIKEPIKQITMAKTTIKNRYGTVPNELLNNELISFKAKGLYAYIQSKPDGWEFSVEKIGFQSKESTEAITSGLKELELFRYLHRVRSQNNLGYWEIEYVLYSEPTDITPYREIPVWENPDTGNDPNNSKKESSKKEISKKYISKNKVFSPPNFEEFEKYFTENGFSSIAKKVFEYYSTADWYDSKGNKVKNWKQKVQGVWFKEDNKVKPAGNMGKLPSGLFT